MKTTTRSNAAALQTATPKNGYKVTPATTALLDCVRAVDELYCRIYDAMALVEPDDVEKRAQPCLEHAYELTNILYKELQQSICNNLCCAGNKNSIDTINI